jgi:hypothetical protein
MEERVRTHGITGFGRGRDPGGEVSMPIEWRRETERLRTSNLAGAIRSFIGPLVEGGAETEVISEALLGERGGLRMNVGRNDLLNVAIDKEGFFRFQLAGQEAEYVEASTIQRVERRLGEYLTGFGLGDQTGDLSRRLWATLGRRMEGLDQGGLTTLVRGLRQNRRITTRERRMMNRFMVGRYRGFATTMFGDEGAPGTMAGLSERMANIAEGSAEWEMLGEKGLYESQQFARAYQRGGSSWVLERGLGGIADMFGDTEAAVAAVSDAITGAGFKMDVGAIRSAFGGGEGQGDLTEMLSRGEVVNQILDQMLKAGNAEKLADPIGSAGRAAHVRPEGTTWGELLRKLRES